MSPGESVHSASVLALFWVWLEAKPGGSALMEITLWEEGEDERLWEIQDGLGAKKGQIMESSSQVPADLGFHRPLKFPTNIRDWQRVVSF